MATSVSQGLSDEQAGGTAGRIARRVTLADSASLKVKLGPAGEGLILDISETGLAAQANMPIQPGSKINVDFDIPEGGHVRTEAQVVWRTADKRMGLRFLRMSEPTRLRLRAWIDTLSGPEVVPAEPVAQASPKAEPAPRNSNEFWHLITEIKASKLYLDSALALIVERAAELTGSTGAALAIGPPENMICRATLGDAPDVGTVINTDSRLTSDCIRTRHTVHVVDTDTDPRVDPFVCRDLNMRSAVLAPAFPSEGDKNFTVVLEMFSSRARNFSAEHIRKLEQLAEVAGVLALGESAEGETAQNALAPGSQSAEAANENLLFAQDELDHLVDRFISDLKIGGPAAPTHESKPTATFETKPIELKKPETFESGYSKKAEPPVSEKIPLPKFENKIVVSTDSSPAVKKPEERKKKASEKPVDLEVVPLAEPFTQAATTRRDAVDHSNFTIGHQPEPSSSKVPMIAAAALLLVAVLGGGSYLLRHHNEKPAQAQSAPVPLPVEPIADPNTSMTVTAPMPKQVSATTTTPLESSKKPTATEAKPAEKETKQNETPKDTTEPVPIVLASAKHNADSSPMAAPTIPMEAVSATPPTDIPASSSSTPELAASARSTGVTPGELIHRVSPRYPSAARSYAVSGDVVLKGRITKEGNVDELKPVSGNPILANAAIDAVKQWKYKPYSVNGKPIDMETTFRIQFALPK